MWRRVDLVLFPLESSWLYTKSGFPQTIGLIVNLRIPQMFNITSLVYIPLLFIQFTVHQCRILPLS